MRRRDPLLVAVVAASIVLASCSRLTFVKPDASRGKVDRVAPEYDIRETPRDKNAAAARRHEMLAEERLRSGQLQAAEAEAKSALKANPRSATAHTLLALIEERNGRAAQAGTHYAKASELAPASGAMLNNYGAWLCGNGRATESLAWFDRALQDPGYGSRASALANAGACAGIAGEHGRVERDLRAALALDPTNAVALLAMAEHALRNGSYLEARAFSERRLAVGPATPQLLLVASQIETQLGDKAAAARYVQRLHREFPQARTAHPGESSPP
ncbi:MAG: type IV pilus biogenesis/stability protein PilW [Pseudomonadota bacterium]|nr:type IV pilus biogenesis/stability protein PilW [Pseudomonadota bacterium]